MQAVIVFGSINMDVSFEASRLPEKGETVLGGDVKFCPGGKGANQAVACARMGAPTSLIGAVGNDAFGASILRGFDIPNLDSSNVQKNAMRPTGTAIISRVDSDNRIVVCPGANHAIDSKIAMAALGALGSEGDILLVQLECPQEQVKEAVIQAKRREMRVYFNPSPMGPSAIEILPLVDLVCVNELEFHDLFGEVPHDEESLRAAVRENGARYSSDLIVTLGSKGFMALMGDEFFSSRAYSVNAIDTSCAGDTFMGAVSAFSVMGWESHDALTYATAAAALTTTVVGAQEAIPTFDEVKAFIERGV
ncbi:ribokinase [Olsenella sp. TM06-36]|uniref:ribokinase n=1 Tax=unclassified Olsenella TaxID=2638792 RepID=UPI000E44CE8D|nr:MULTISPECIES: ribokinase [unclassified Olsenella]RGJ46767.1 ribokinase [Olsenella sp. TM06-36]RHJ92824.1 ribokinase [Olsenella sp. AM05-7]RHJ97856.1 ribokinase [Olsenella sp. AM05-17]